MRATSQLKSLFICILLALPCEINAQQQQFPAGNITITQILNAPAHPYYNTALTQHERHSLQSLYQLNLNQLLWFNTDHPINSINQLLALFSQAPTHGLNSSDYATELLTKHWHTLQQSTPSFYEFAVFDNALSLSLLRYLHDLHYGRVDPQQLGFHLPYKKTSSFSRLIFNAVQTNSLNALIADNEPKLIPYQQLKVALAKYRRLNQHFIKQPFFHFEQSLRPGDWSTQINALEHYLDAFNTDLEHTIAPPQPQNNTYTESMVRKIRHFQTAHGLQSDGIIGKQTLAAINTPISQRIAQIELAMERLRWLPDEYQGSVILVNIPAFQLWAYNSAEPQDKVLTMSVIVGKAKAKNEEPETETILQTPVFAAKLNYLVFSPYWNIPKSILNKEILPLLEKNPDYLERNNMEIVARFAHNATVHPANAENIARLYTDELKLRQRPSARNALGRLKFIFPNNYKVYLHDTPARRLFNRTKRDFSHGCVRVANPQALAQFVLDNQPEWDGKTIKEAMRADAPIIASVNKKIPVLIFYTTALVNKMGLSFYPDIYGHDPALQAALSMRSQNLAKAVLLPTTDTTSINMHKVGTSVKPDTATR
ncbi:MAG: L,D-transpeptidase YcbB [Methyloprofundus sp.]|nr:MAG: L,D-transpeptidase YcbB [Methyloprofundus sp.]